MDKFKMFLIFMFLFLPTLVFAEDNDMFLECAKTEAKIGEEVNCTVSAICAVDCPYAEFGLTADTPLTFTKSFTVAKDAVVQLLENDEIALPANKIGLIKRGNSTIPIATKFTLGTFSIKVPDGVTVGNNYTITLSNGSLMNDSPTAIRTNINVTTEIKALAKDSEDPGTVVTTGVLSDLKVISGGYFMPAFDKNAKRFGLILDSASTTTFKLQATAENNTDRISAKNTDTGETIDLSNEITFKPGDGGTMSITITVGDGSGAKEYTVIVQRDKPSGVGIPALSSLMIGNIKVDLIDEKLDYTVVLSENEIKDYLIVAELTDPQNFKFDNTDILSPHDMSGEQELEIKIVPKNANSSYGSETYIINIISAGDSSKQETPLPSDSGNINQNPKTGSGAAILMGLLLIISFVASVYFYKRNMSQYE